MNGTRETDIGGGKDQVQRAEKLAFSSVRGLRRGSGERVEKKEVRGNVKKIWSLARSGRLLSEGK